LTHNLDPKLLYIFMENIINFELYNYHTTGNGKPELFDTYL